MEEFKEHTYMTSPTPEEEIKKEEVVQEEPVREVKKKETVYTSSIAPAVRQTTLPIEKVDSGRYSTTNNFVQVVYFIASVTSLFVLLRFVFQLLGAANVGFVNIIYQLTNPLVLPFRGFFGQPVFYGTGRFEIEALLAILAISIFAFVLSGLIKLLGGTDD